MQSIRYRFMVLIVLVFIPVALFDMYYETLEKQRSTVKITDDLKRSTNTVVEKINGLIETSRELLTGLAAVQEIKSGDAATCSDFLHDIGGRYSKYTNFSVVNQDKYIFCSSGALPKPVHVANSHSINAAFATGKFAVSPFKFGVLTGKPILVFSEPLLNKNNQVVGTVNNGLSMTWLGAYFSTVVSLEGEHIVVFDDNGVVLAAFPDPLNSVGSVLSDDNLLNMPRKLEGGVSNITLAGGGDVMATSAVIPQIPGGAHVVAYTSLDIVQNEIRYKLYQRLAVIGFLTAISLVLVWAGAKALLLTPIDRLVATAEALAKGDLKVRSDVSNQANELGRLGMAFDQMAVALDTRTQAMERAEKKSRQLAYTDHFTGMPNEAFFLEKLNENIEQNCQGFVAAIELSGMGDIVGTFGLEASELIIYETGARLTEQMNTKSVAARTGERLFKVLYVSEDEHEIIHLRSIAERLYMIASDSFDLMGSSVYVNVSMGICIIDPQESTPQTILTDVEIALHEAKETITSDIVYFENAIKERLIRSTQIVAWLRRAIENREFELFFQPQVNLKSNTVVGCEALIRWQEKPQNWISPAEFIPIAEKSGLIEEITTWTVDEACSKAAAWGTDHALSIRVGINISAEELASPEFLHYVTKFIEKTKLPAALLEIEITETALMKDVEMASRNLRKVRDMGATVAIDDFGTGQASLAYLKQFPIDRLKIDQSFVHGAPNNKTDQEIIVSIVNLAHSLGIEVIAEGAEEEEHIKLLVSLGCDEVQGYHIAKPMPADEFVKFVKAHG